MSASESIRQLLLLIKSARLSLSNEKKTNWASDAISSIDAFLETYAQVLSHAPVVGGECLSYNSEWSFTNAHKSLTSALKMLRDIQYQNLQLGCVPDRAFTVCIQEVEQAEKLFEFNILGVNRPSKLNVCKLRSA